MQADKRSEKGLRDAHAAAKRQRQRDAYREQAKDKEAEAEALEWAEGLMGDAMEDQADS